MEIPANKVPSTRPEKLFIAHTDVFQICSLSGRLQRHQKAMHLRKEGRKRGTASIFALRLVHVKTI